MGYRSRRTGPEEGGPPLPRPQQISVDPGDWRCGRCSYHVWAWNVYCPACRSFVLDDGNAHVQLPVGDFRCPGNDQPCGEIVRAHGTQTGIGTEPNQCWRCRTQWRPQGDHPTGAASSAQAGGGGSAPPVAGQQLAPAGGQPGEQAGGTAEDTAERAPATDEGNLLRFLLNLHAGGHATGPAARRRLLDHRQYDGRTVLTGKVEKVARYWDPQGNSAVTEALVRKVVQEASYQGEPLFTWWIGKRHHKLRWYLRDRAGDAGAGAAGATTPLHTPPASVPAGPPDPPPGVFPWGGRGTGRVGVFLARQMYSREGAPPPPPVWAPSQQTAPTMPPGYFGAPSGAQVEVQGDQGGAGHPPPPTKAPPSQAPWATYGGTRQPPPQVYAGGTDAGKPSAHSATVAVGTDDDDWDIDGGGQDFEAMD